MAAADGGEVAGYLTRWKPARGTAPAAAAFARAVVAAAGPGSQDRAQAGSPSPWSPPSNSESSP